MQNKKQHWSYYKQEGRGGGGVRPASGRLGVRIPAATDLRKSLKQADTAPLANAWH